MTSIKAVDVDEKKTELHGTASELALSRFSATLLLIMYVVFLYFQLVSHTDFFEDEPASTENNGETKDDSFISNTSKKKKDDDENDHNEIEEEKDDDDSDDDEDEDPELGFTEAIYYMAAITLFISILSDVIVGTIKQPSVLELPGGVHLRRHVTDCRQRRRTRLGGHVRFTQQNGHLHRASAIGSSTQISHVRLPALRLRRVGDGQTSRFEHESLRNRLVGFMRRHRDVLHTRRERKLVERFDLDFSVRILAASVFFPRRTAGGRVSRDQPVSHRWMMMITTTTTTL